jgi:hypothetical protein
LLSERFRTATPEQVIGGAVSSLLGNLGSWLIIGTLVGAVAVARKQWRKRREREKTVEPFVLFGKPVAQPFEDDEEPFDQLMARIQRDDELRERYARFGTRK